MSAVAVEVPLASIAVVLGTRPEAIKLAPVVEVLGPRAAIVHTGQHYDATLGSDVLDELAFPPADHQLGVGGSRRGAQIGAAVAALDALFVERRPAAVVVQGDTNATVAGAIAANAAEVPLVHVEAGLRSYDRAMPEEHNRILADHLADLCCAPTEVSAANLAREGISGGRVVVTGNTIVDVLSRLLLPPDARRRHLDAFGIEADRFVLATLHRPENVDHPEPYAAVLEALAQLRVPVVLPLHPRSVERARRFGLDGLLARLHVTAPLAPRQFLALAAESALIVSDSGGLQEEASVLKRPVIVVRRSTERPEVQGTFAEVVAPGGDLVGRARAWLDDPARRAALASVPTPYGDGRASVRIVESLTELVTA
ncbi:MAG: non-hydrolyzing UDP-N-acetylglucosamine 2-epimerase [Acidimicrobiales bacterium]